MANKWEYLIKEKLALHNKPDFSYSGASQPKQWTDQSSHLSSSQVPDPHIEPAQLVVIIDRLGYILGLRIKGKHAVLIYIRDTHSISAEIR